MKRLHLFIASFAMLSLMGVAFNWTEADRPVVIDILGVLGTFTWLPLLIGAAVWAYRGSKPRQQSPSR
jgi:hypothetical protein